MLPKNYEVLSPADVNWTTDIEETGTSLNENAFLKAKALFDHCGLPVLADDSGLLVEELQGLPGVRSARFAGEKASDDENMSKLLRLMNGKTNRGARFETVLAWIDQNEIKYFKGVVEGTIVQEARGNNGFGYDPIFIPEGQQQTFGELPPFIKKQLSHRSKALQAFLNFLKTKG